MERKWFKRTKKVLGVQSKRCHCTGCPEHRSQTATKDAPSTEPKGEKCRRHHSHHHQKLIICSLLRSCPRHVTNAAPWGSHRSIVWRPGAGSYPCAFHRP
ncbi:hypothetical protein J6590_004603 [Homalodisca vitripennis]|nr:hypothetical protein J6590_004603 [Homalodisca vitripennis]